jgi:hypothetical protein
LTISASALADQSTIKIAGDHDAYVFEAEPHLLFSPYAAPDNASGEGWGLGFRGTVILSDKAFVPRINNSVGITFGADWVHFAAPTAYDAVCTQWTPTAGGLAVCTSTSGGSDSNYLYFPVALQWNFWFTHHWSAFGEIGVTPYFRFDSYDSHVGVVPILIAIGGRYRITKELALTLRLGYPTMSFGVSFLL